MAGIVLLTSLDAAAEERWCGLLQDALPEETIVAGARFAPTGVAAGDVDVAIVANPQPVALAPFTNLRFVQSLWAGVEKLVGLPTLRRDVPLARLVDPAMSRAMAEAVTAHVLALHRDHARFARGQRDRVWSKDPQKLAHQRTVGFLGLGELAGASIELLTPLGFDLRGWSRSPKTIAGVATFHGDDGLATMLGEVEILVNLLPLTPTTERMLGRPLFQRLPRGAMVVNVARGAHVVDAELLAALDEGQLAEAVLDVFEVEPLPTDHPFWAHPRVQLFPHVAAQTDPVTASRIAAANVRAFRAGRPVANVVDRSRGY
ncbi:MAG: glyoxylate/hydroxypyruvate reductase A [Pseudomonadota bacterium]